MLRTLSAVLCILLVVSAAVVHGSATHRWSMLAPDPARAATVHAHTVALADYQSLDVPSELPVKERSAVTCRQYTSPTGLPPVVVSVTSGPPGAVSTHTPDVCYPGSGYKTLKSPKVETIDLPNGRKATYFVAEFEKKTVSTYERQRIRWAWSTNGTWDVPSNARFAYLREPELFKIYIVTAHPAVEIDKTDKDSPAIRDFVAKTFQQYSGLLGQN